VAYRSCRRRQARAAGDRGSKKVGGRKQKQQTEATTPTASVVTKSTVVSECKYRKAKGPKGACDAATNTRTVTRQLKKNGPASCEATKTFTEACRPAKPKQGGRKNPGRSTQ
jgi:hypothetical protein